MGMVFKQSASNLLTTYFGFGIGAINTLFLYTNFLEQEYYGLVSFLLSAANLIWPLMAFGMHNTLVKFFSSYSNSKDRDGLMGLVLLLPFVIALVLGGIGYFSYAAIMDYFSGENNLVQPYVWLIFAIAIAMAYFEIFFSWSKIQYKSVFGNFMREVFHRFCIAILLLAVYLDWLSVEGFIYCTGLVYVLRTILMMGYAFRLYSPKLSFQLPSNSSSVLKYSSLILIAGSVAMALLDLDKFMIEYFLPIENVAVYGIAIYIASVIGVPSRAMHQITYPMTAKLMNQKDKAGLRELYQKSSINLLVISGFIFLLIVTNIRQIYELIPDEYQLPFSIVVLISGVKLYDNLLGNNNSILFNSDYYRLVLAVGVGLAVLAFILNLLLIPILGLSGAAIATFLAFLIYNTSKVGIVIWKFSMHPFSVKTIIGLSGILVLGLGFYFWDFSLPPFLSILFKSLLLSLLYLPFVYAFRLSGDINQVLESFLRKK